MSGNRRSIRLKEYDYSKEGAYFVTVCAYKRECMFGEIINGTTGAIMILNEYGRIIEKCWIEINTHFDNVQTDYFVIMPNHIHGIITVGARFPRPAQSNSADLPGRVSPIGRGDLAPTTTLGKIIAYFKYTSTKQINVLRDCDIRKIWQRNYYERVIRNDRELHQIREYILRNPMNWETDAEFRRSLYS